MDRKIYSVSELSLYLKGLIDQDQQLAGFWLRGEITNFKRHTSGHLYFSLKDESSTIRAVMFRSRAAGLKFTPRDGLDCLVRGYVSLYAKETALQFYAEELVPAGLGLQSIALAELKEKLQKKSYFAPERKRSLPILPQGVGVVSSPTGAAIRDISRVIQRRYPGMPIILYPSLVQGEKAAESVAEGIRILCTRSDLDVIIVARGGGSAEDLSVFNAEIVADAIFQSTKPVVSAIGHEIDFTITDLVADVRAATPSMAGELVVPVKAELIQMLHKQKEHLFHLLDQRINREKMRLSYLTETRMIRNPERWLDQFREELGQKEEKLSNSMHILLKQANYNLSVAAAKLNSLSPLSTLARGYSICKGPDGHILTDSRKVAVNDRIYVQLCSGSLNCSVLTKEDCEDAPGR
ncbi:MAG TPA: exodeoxyribonuclease VII large subunit [Peptococcaceae bacterium]|jgi:exodeoxyribonuclease VII large subunit|nr:exodeoxyribonuclease VII large subunit [Peptococcaceae bacterium]HPZ71662.1 exodeoxyribonuclease VII large subunit [Peptococcaceae bacterium]HQD53598.1 exodeoxyribonuclease VII large subunit [Peptococcaceae bacterium]